jgi:glycosyltransferase involved in cell wall biosynthesis
MASQEPARSRRLKPIDPIEIDQVAGSTSTRAKRACLLTETFHPVTGGGEMQAKALAYGLARDGRVVQVLTRRTDPALASHEQLGRVRVHRLPPSGAGQLKKWGLAITTFLALLRQRDSYDVIIVCGFRVLGVPAVVAARLLKKPCLLKADVRGELSGAFLQTGLNRVGLSNAGRLLRGALDARNRLLRRAEGFVAISSVIENEFRRSGIPPERVHCIPNSVDTALFSPASEQEKRELRERLGIPLEDAVAVYTGRLETTKGLPVLLEAWRKTINDDSGVHLLLVGAGGLGIHNCEAQLKQYVENNGLGEFVTFTGSVENVRDYLCASDFFVFPSQREAFGISVVEALACKLPVITTTAGGLADIVTHEETALVVPAGDVEALANAIRRALQERLSHLGEAGRALVERRYSQSLVLDRYSELLDDVVTNFGSSANGS